MGKTKRRSPRSFRSDEQCECAVCGRLTRAYFYKLYVCCACTMFYRRNFRSYPRAQCRFKDENCNLKSGPRRFCLRCRLSACRELGLRMWGKNLVVQANGMPADDIPEEKLEVIPIEQDLEMMSMDNSHDYICSPASSSSSGYSSSSSTMCEELFVGEDPLQFLNQKSVELPCLKKITDLFRQFDDQQKFLSTFQQKAEIFDYAEENLVYMDQVQYKELEIKVSRAAAVLVAQFLSEFELEDEDALAIVKSVIGQISFLHKIQHTIRQFPNKSSNISLFSGYYSDLTNLEDYFADIADTCSYQHVANSLRVFISHFYSLLDECRMLQVHPVEISYLIGKSIAEELGTSLSATTFANNLSSEFFQYLDINFYTSERFLSITAFGNGVKNLLKTYRQAVEEISAISDDLMVPLNGNLSDRELLNYVNLYRYPR
ncbi:unnamed protein product [Bursaphelenchus xylophilus]|uniref:(pine wood nematode) hypothetical protein n=1 Tax=Bursaphelenchus xylophilus TaxID=6326 RepID=A0A1I7RJ18_BURXY|nr:unnamed protein product [Bursaphelenchus xylophilus]CAG9119262.1 unnamed protein product [Bursaphelenchus xylophilus]